MSRGSDGTTTTTTCGARNYRPCHLKVPQLLAAGSPRCHEIDSRSYRWPTTARTSYSVGAEESPLLLLQSRQGRMDPLTTCRSQSASPYYTKYLEGKIIMIQEQYQNVEAERMKLCNQLSRAASRSRELEEKAAALEDSLLRERHEREKQQQQQQLLQAPPAATHQHRYSTRAVSATVSLIDASTTTRTQEEDSPQMYDCAVQTMPPERHQKAIECLDDTRDLVSITKSELMSLENDMKTLRNAVREREDLWKQTIEREHSYHEHLARLSVEMLTLRQLSESRHIEVQVLAQKLTDRKDEIKAMQRELTLTKKAITKQQKRQRLTEEYSNQEWSDAAGDCSEKQQMKSPKSPGKLQQQQQHQRSKTRDTARGSPRHTPRIEDGLKDAR